MKTKNAIAITLILIGLVCYSFLVDAIRIFAQTKPWIPIALGSFGAICLIGATILTPIPGEEK